MSNNHKERFYSKLRETKKFNSKTLSRDDIRAIKSFLINGTSLEASQAFKRRISRNKFKLVNTGAGGEDKLFTVKKKSDLKGDDNQVSYNSSFEFSSSTIFGNRLYRSFKDSV